MRCLQLLLWVSIALWQCSTALLGGEYRLTNGDIIRGEPVSYNDDGMVVRLDIGGHSPRISWSKLTQESLQELLKDARAAKFVEPFIELPPAPKEKEAKKEIILKSVPRVERIERPNFFASFTTPAGIAVFLVLFLANLYAAYEIARFRYRPPALVCGLSALFPIVAPIIFLSLPPSAAAEADAGADTAAQAAATQAQAKATTGPLAKAQMASGLSIARGEKEAAAVPSGTQVPQVYKRGEFTFNRRFFESKFPGFFRVVQSEAEKDLVLLVRSAGGEHVAKRVTRISSNEVHLQLARGGEVSVPFAEISEVQLRQKDSKG